MTTYEEVIQDLEARVIMPERAPGLYVTIEGLKALDRAYDPKKVIVVAGTNGKGTVSCTLATLLKATGAKVGLYTSPHLVDTTERIQINNTPISKEDFVEAFLEVKKKTSRQNLSHFEMLTLMAHWYFVNQKCDWIVYEVGLGGIWDSTNAVEHNTSVITQLGFDHQDILGNTLREIAKNKLGIIRDTPEHKVIYWPVPDEIKDLFSGFREVAKPDFRVDTSGFNPVYILKTEWGEAPLKLLGQRAIENSSVALEVFKSIGFDPGKYLSVLKEIDWPGRMERVNVNGKRVYLSGDHNVQGVESLREILTHFKYDKIYAVVGIGKAKDFSPMLESLAQVSRLEMILTETPFRGLKISEYGSWREKSLAVDSAPKKAFEFALKKAREKDLVLVTGSLYLVGEIKKLLASRVSQRI